MTETLPFKQKSHLHPLLTEPSATAHVSGLLGHWLNTNFKTRGIAECEITQDDAGVLVNIVGAETEWPSARATVLANLEEEAGQRSVALMATFELDFMTAETHIRVNKGVLVIVLYVTFHDDSYGSNYLNREFFYLAD